MQDFVVKCLRLDALSGNGDITEPYSEDRNFRKDGTAMDFQIIDNCLMIRLPEEIDHHEAGFICETADRYLLREEVCNVVFDFERTRFMDSSGIGIIMGRYRKISCFGGRVYAIHLDRQIERIFKMSGLDKVVEILNVEQMPAGAGREV